MFSRGPLLYILSWTNLGLIEKLEKKKQNDESLIPHLDQILSLDDLLGLVSGMIVVVARLQQTLCPEEQRSTSIHAFREYLETWYISLQYHKQ